MRLGKIRCGRLPRVYKNIETIDTTGMGGKRSSLFSVMFGAENHHGIFANDPLLFAEITRLISVGERPPHKRTPELAQFTDRAGMIYWAYDSKLDIHNNDK